MKSVEADIRDQSRLCGVIADFRPTIVFHLAAQPIVRRSFDDPLETISVNVLGGANLLEAVRTTDSVRSLVFITSDKCYENKNWLWGYRETDELGGHDPYSASKAAVEVIFSAYQRSFFAHREGLGAATTRAGNVIGGGDWSADRLVPDCIRALKEGRDIVIRSPGATRPWQFVLDPLRGYMALALSLLEDAGGFGGAWNFGPGSRGMRTVREVTDRIVKGWGSGDVRYEPESDSLKTEALLLQLSSEKAESLLHWTPTYSVDQAIDETTIWYKRIFEGDDPISVSRDQLSDFVTAGTLRDQWRQDRPA
jgi:CDP-glucose 4,6-dehydratase